MKYPHILMIKVYILFLFTCFFSEAKLLVISQNKRVLTTSDHVKEWSEYPLSANNPHVDFFDIKQKNKQSDAPDNLYIIGYDTHSKELVLFSSKDGTSFTREVVPVRIKRDQAYHFARVKIGITQDGVAVMGFIRYPEQPSNKFSNFFMISVLSYNSPVLLWTDTLPNLRVYNPHMSNPVIIDYFVGIDGRSYRYVANCIEKDGQPIFNQATLYSADTDLFRHKFTEISIDSCETDNGLPPTLLIDQQFDHATLFFQEHGSAYTYTTIHGSAAYNNFIAYNSFYSFFPEIALFANKKHIFFAREKDSNTYALVTASIKNSAEAQKSISMVKKVHTVDLPESSYDIKGYFLYLQDKYLLFITSKHANGTENKQIVLQSKDGLSWQALSTATIPQDTLALYHIPNSFKKAPKKARQK